LGRTALLGSHLRRLNQGWKDFGSTLSPSLAKHLIFRDIVNQEQPMIGLMQILRCPRGGSAIEYALVASLISIAAIGAINGLGSAIDTMFNNVSNHL
jgi:pilus assembly protein Flp/PilA